MKITSLLLFLFLILLSGCDTRKVYNRTIESDGGEKMLYGRYNEKALQKGEFAKWFAPNYENYQLHSESIKKLKRKLILYRVEVYMGTWCSDSRREIPRFMKIMDSIKFPKARIDYYAVNPKKQSLYGEEVGRKIKRVPTFIFYKQGREVNRIVEYPVSETLEQDILAILNGEEYVPNYSEE